MAGVREVSRPGPGEPGRLSRMLRWRAEETSCRWERVGGWRSNRRRLFFSVLVFCQLRPITSGPFRIAHLKLTVVSPVGEQT
jgi:hypothetical protein